MPVYFSMEEPLTHEDMGAIIELYAELSPDKPPVTEADVVAVWQRGGLLLARIEGSGDVCGMASLATYRKLNGTVGVIEEVIVAEQFRGEGVAMALIGGLIAYGKRLGLLHINLTSRPDRFEANALYRRLGFEKRETNVYRFML